MISSPTERTMVEVVMPQMGISVAEGTVTEWRRQVGDPISADETICEVTTDKIDVEIPAPVSGHLARITVAAGETVAVGAPLAEIDTGGGIETDHGGGEGEAGGEIDRSGFHSPVVRRIAGEHGIDLSTVEGHGVGGRIRKIDLLAFIEGQAGANGRPAASGALHSDSPYRPDPDAIPAPGADPDPIPATDADPLVGPTSRERLGPMRQAIGRHMLASLQTSAQCTTIVEADFSAVAARRAESADRSSRPTYLAFVARSVVEALRRHPVLNASIDGDELILHEDVNLGIAVALEDGLIVPVIRRAQTLSVEGLAEAIRELAERARGGRLQPDDIHGATFTITNPGQFGALLATPIINQPQVGILDLEAVVRRPVAVAAGPDGEDSALAIRPMGYLCLSWDHRALDGAEAARFLGEIRQGIESGAAR